MNGSIDELECFEFFDRYDDKLDVIVMPVHLRGMLLQYLNRSISIEILNKWAKFIYRYFHEHCREHFFEHFCNENGNTMWCIIEKLATFDKIDLTPERILTYLLELEKTIK